MYPYESTIKISKYFDYLNMLLITDNGFHLIKIFLLQAQRSRTVAGDEQRSSILDEKNKIDVIDGFGKPARKEN
jgi:hypothetical protein